MTVVTYKKEKGKINDSNRSMDNRTYFIQNALTNQSKEQCRY